MKFYFIDQNYSNNYAQLTAKNYKIEEVQVYENGELSTGVKFVYTEPYLYTVKGVKLADHYPLMAGTRLISNAVIEIFQKEGIKFGDVIPWVCDGWTDKKGNALDIERIKYYMLSPVKCGVLYDNDGNEIPASGPNLSNKGFSIDIDSWDGSDIFTFNNFGAYVATERVKEIVENNKLKNFTFKDIGEPWFNN
ncbi:MAG: hypothetical protein IJC04_11425 [Oscillospiraceae bacterium]|nr:hypothetical protein [Oscillospiraceae bacterium]